VNDCLIILFAAVTVAAGIMHSLVIALLPDKAQDRYTVICHRIQKAK